jgi:hypothetical protein
LHNAGTCKQKASMPPGVTEVATATNAHATGNAEPKTKRGLAMDFGRQATGLGRKWVICYVPWYCRHDRPESLTYFLAGKMVN